MFDKSLGYRFKALNPLSMIIYVKMGIDKCPWVLKKFMH